MQMLSPHFSLEEMIHSDIAIEKGIQNVADDKIISNLTNLCVNILEPLRNYFDKPVKILSGYRCPELNALLGGSSNSQHILGEAADICIGGLQNVQILDYVKTYLPFDQLIAERLQRHNPYAGWVHISYDECCKRREVLSFLGNGLYVKGLSFTDD